LAIKDLLWACPECGRERGLRRRGRVEVCIDCGTRFRRGAGDLIEAERPGQGTVARPARAWLERLPEARLPWEGAESQAGCVFEERVEIRVAEGQRAIRLGRQFFGWVERFGPKHRGTLRLGPEGLSFRGEDGQERSWPLAALTAVQASSSSLQLKARQEPVVSIRFPEGSARLWEALVERALRLRYRAEGRGEIVEFQPRIVAR
jgi:hypothetical protein